MNHKSIANAVGFFYVS